jgi:hypothetical protein
MHQGFINSEVAVRNTLVIGLFLGGLLMSTTAGLAQQTAPATPATTPDAAPADDPNEVICKAGAPVVGSRFPTARQCHTRKEWDQIRRDSQEALQQQQMERSYNTGGK